MQRSTTGEVVGVEYWLKWQVPVCGLIMLIPAAVSIRMMINKSSSSNTLWFDHLWVPCWRNLHPMWLLLYRAMALVTMAWLLYEMILYAGLFAFFFYTQWTFTLVMLYFAVGTFISAKGCFMASQQLHTKTSAKTLNNGVEANGKTTTTTTTTTTLLNHNTPISSQDAFLGSFMHIVYQTSAGASLLTDLVFWFILVPMLSKTDFQMTLVIACIHSVNAIFLIIDSLLNGLPFQWFGFNYFILWTVSYAVFQWVSHACCTAWWPYPFLELSTPWAPLWYIGIAVIHVPCYGLYVLLIKAKNSIFSKLFPQAFVRSNGEAARHNKAN